MMSTTRKWHFMMADEDLMMIERDLRMIDAD